MNKIIKSDDGSLEVTLYEGESIPEGHIFIESCRFQRISTRIKPVDPTGEATPLGAIYRVCVIKKDSNQESGSEIDSAYILRDGKILTSREYDEYMARGKFSSLFGKSNLEQEVEDFRKDAEKKMKDSGRTGKKAEEYVERAVEIYRKSLRKEYGLDK